MPSRTQESPGRRFDRPPECDPKFGYLGYGMGPEFQEPKQPNGVDQPDDGYGYEGDPATAPGDEAGDEWIDDEDLALQLNAYTAVGSRLSSTTWTTRMPSPCS